ncbi:MAG: hypothetical protein HKN21_01935 [Candidatus Eisenbacteria bacterium]|uniref:Endonuclease/exonuclease/phosphatase domain-containing protein n=1 Tax=Eiseniibacteriota bacterium TaxID=2212470 RepID=A0A7Y2H1C4_UNCEI|nr:hypothetical protein [Candidatus Eisenbacteria bacterium]
MIKTLFALSLLLSAIVNPAPGEAANANIVIDGIFADWDRVPLAYEFLHVASTDEPPLVTHVWASSNRDRLALRFQLSSEVLLQGTSQLALHIDTDKDVNTGSEIDGFGADFSWFFSEREGRIRVMGAPLRISQSDIGLRQAPVISAEEFEVSLDRQISLAGEPFLPGSHISFSLHEFRDDELVSSTGRIDLELSAMEPEPPKIGTMEKEPGHLRVLTYNVLYDGCFERPLPFRRIMDALEPDIISLQELYKHSTQETLEWVQRVLPDSDWHAAGFGQGVILSKYPVLEWGPIGTQRRGAWAILEIPDGKMAVLNPHPPCCGNDAGRQEEYDAMAAWIRDARASGKLDEETAVVVAGDANLVGDSQQLDTLLNGAIVDTATHGPVAAPDGDGTSLADANPYHLSGTEAYTWRDDSSEFSPGKLDYIVYSDSVLGVSNAFILWTPDLPEAVLRETRLEADDTKLASDHLPVVADFYFRAAASSR